MEDGIEKHSVSFVMLLCVYYCPFMLHHLKNRRKGVQNHYILRILVQVKASYLGQVSKGIV